MNPLTVKPGQFCMVILALGAATCARANDLPTNFSFARYKAMLEHSPFSVATAVVAPAATPSFAKDLYLANAAKSIDGDMVTIASTSDRDFKKYLTTKTPVDGYAIVSIEWSDKVGETKATISKDGQLATLTFNQMIMAQPFPNRPPAITSPVFPQQPSFQKPVALPSPPQASAGNPAKPIYTNATRPS